MIGCKITFEAVKARIISEMKDDAPALPFFFEVYIPLHICAGK